MNHSSTSGFEIHIRKEAIKFSSAHMTVFPDGGKEPIHGHNYQVELSVHLDRDAMILKNMISFQVFKDAMKTITREWDEKVLVPLKCPFLTDLKKDHESVEFRLCGKRYVLPQDEVVELSVDNISTEILADVFLNQLLEKVAHEKWMSMVQSIAVRIDESRGQGASVEWRQKS